MIVALLLLLDIALMGYLISKVARAARPGAEQTLGLLAYHEERPQALPAPKG
jgi:hypothetical protein